MNDPSLLDLLATPIFIFGFLILLVIAVGDG